VRWRTHSSSELRYRETNVALDFDLYYSVPPDEMDALKEVVAAARALAQTPALVGAGQAPAHRGNGVERRDLAALDLTRSLAALDAVRTRRDGRRTGTLAPWLHEHLRRSTGRGSGWRPRELEPGATFVSANDGPKVAL
jgi:hypothetical protein